MSRKWITTKRDRDSAIYKKLHQQLRRETRELIVPTSTKAERKRVKSHLFVRTAEV